MTIWANPTFTTNYALLIDQSSFGSALLKGYGHLTMSKTDFLKHLEELNTSLQSCQNMKMTRSIRFWHPKQSIQFEKILNRFIQTVAELEVIKNGNNLDKIGSGAFKPETVMTCPIKTEQNSNVENDREDLSKLANLETNISKELNNTEKQTDEWELIENHS